MFRVLVQALLLITAHLPLLCAELSRSEGTTSVSGREGVKHSPCGKDCEDRIRVRKRSALGPKCELYYFLPTAKHTDEAFFFWNNTKAEQLNAYRKIVPFLQANSHKDEPLFFPAHLPLVKKRGDGRDALVLKDVYVRAQGTCGELPGSNYPGYFDTNPEWFGKPDQKLQVELRMLEDYVQRIPRSHWGYRVPKAGEDDVCLDETGLVVKDFPGIRTCFSMWIFDDVNEKPKHFAGRQIYNRINQTLHVNNIVFNSSAGDSPAETVSLPALFLKEMCFVTNSSHENRCTYWTATNFYVSLCCCYTNRTECAYRTYKFPS
ncbi:hypothetical protein AAVH_10970 [Aphelenchoides avenae]|nr:hypothetical protein AAVH_10970 [Aphelenchus avenae]